MSEDRFSARLAWVREGAGPELDCPHSLFEVSIAEGYPRILDRTQCMRLIKAGQFNADESHLRTLESGEVLASFAIFNVLLQRRAGHEVARQVTLPQGSSSATAAVEHIWAPAAQWAAELAVQLVDIACGRLVATDRNLMDAIFAYEKLCTAGPRVDHRYLFVEARRRGLPAVLKPPFDLLLGHGINQRRLHRFITDRTSHLGVRLSTSKTRTLQKLANAGLPVPFHVPAANLAEAQKAAQTIGFPLVVKPVNTDRGIGVTVGITSAAELERAYHIARQHDAEVAVEQFVPGETYRLLVVDGKFIAAACTQATPVIGDGKSTVREIVNRINLSPSRGPGHLKPLSFMELDNEALAILKSLSLTPESVLPFGRTIRLRSVSNLSRGGQSISVTDQVHPDNRKLAEACARIIGLDLTGIDFRSTAIGKSWKDGYGAVIEVNPSPGLRMHVNPGKGQESDIAGPILDLLYPNGAPSRIPIVAVTGTNGKTTTTRMIAHMLMKAGLVTGVTTTDEAAVSGRIIQRGDCAGAGPARRVLSVPLTEAAVLETARGGVIKYGLGFDRCSVAVVTNIEADHLGELGVQTIEDLARVKLTVPMSAGRVVLNAGNHHCLDMRRELQGKEIVLFSTVAGNHAVREHLAGGGTAYVLRESGQGEVILRLRGEEEAVLLPSADIPVTFGGSAKHNVENALAAFAAVYCLGIDDTTACEAARSFLADAESNRGRLNPFPGFPFEVFVDYAHNKHAFEAIGGFVDRRMISGRKLCVVTMNASRISSDNACDAMTALAGHFDHYVTCNHDSPKKRREGFSQVLANGLSVAGVHAESITICGGEDEAIDIALSLASPGDMIMLLIGYEPHRILEVLRNRVVAPEAES
jgi:cyanophycin synthetase